MAHPAIQRFAALSIWTLGLLYSGARLMLDIIGYTTAPDDFAQLQERMPNWLEWLFSTPWPVPAGLMVVLTGFVIYVCWPQRSSAHVEDRQPDSTPISTTASQPGGDPIHWWHRIIATAAPSEPPAFDEKGLYVGSMVVSTGKLQAEGWVEITARCFNATGHDAYSLRVDGAINLSEALGGSAPKVGTLPPPHLVHDRNNDRYADRKEFILRLEQRVPKEFADRILAVDEDYAVSFDLQDMDVIICSHDSPSEQARLPVWDGISLRRSPDRITSDRNISATARSGSARLTS